MIKKHDWDEALDVWTLGERERLGGPPTPAQIVAYTRGELPAAESTRVRALLVYYPELTPWLRAPKRPALLRRFLPLAAGLLIATLTVVHSRWEDRQPYVHQTRHELQSLHARGPGEEPVYELPADEERYLLALVVYPERDYASYRVELVNARSNVVWQSDVAQPADGTFEVSVPQELIRGGTHRINVYGIDGTDARRLESFRIRVERRK
jgi:hypothetical protein